MSPVTRTPRKAFSKALTEITTPKKKQNIAAKISLTPLSTKLGNLSLKSPAARKGQRSPSNDLDKENVLAAVSKKKKVGAKKRLPLGEFNRDEELFAPRTSASTDQFRPTSSSSSQLEGEKMDFEVADCKPKTTPKKRNLTQKKTPKTSTKIATFDNKSETSTWTIESKSPLKITLRRSLSRSQTPQTNSQPLSLDKYGFEKEYNSDEDTVKSKKELEEECDSDEDIPKHKYNRIEDEYEEDTVHSKNNENDCGNDMPQTQFCSLEDEYNSGEEDAESRNGLEEGYDSGRNDNGKNTFNGLEPEYVESEDSDESSVLFGSRDTVPLNTVETFEEEPTTAEVELLLNTISKLDFDVMKEEAQQQADMRQKREKNPLMKIYPLFHTSAIPDVLLKRDEQSKVIDKFIKNAIGPTSSVHNRTIYISGVPGTGKTACVTKVIQKLQHQKKPVLKFDYVYVNGLELVKPQHVFTEIYKVLFPSTRPPASKTAREKLAKLFTFEDPKRKPIVLVIDELDMLCTKSQDVVYDIFDWASTSEARLSVIAIANTLDLPERVLKQRVSSRMGYNRLTFQPYNHDEIKHILEHRIKKFKISKKGDVLGFISRKVAAVSGDVRKALEFIRRAIEIAVDNDDEILTMEHAKAAVNEGLQSLPSLFTKSLSQHQEILLRSIIQEIRATSLEELDFFLVYDCYRRNCVALGVDSLDMCIATGLLSSLQNIGYIDVKSNGLISRRITLKSSVDEIDYLLKQMKITEET